MQHFLKSEIVIKSNFDSLTLAGRNMIIVLRTNTRLQTGETTEKNLFNTAGRSLISVFRTGWY